MKMHELQSMAAVFELLEESKRVGRPLEYQNDANTWRVMKPGYDYNPNQKYRVQPEVAKMVIEIYKKDGKLTMDHTLSSVFFQGRYVVSMTEGGDVSIEKV